MARRLIVRTICPLCGEQVEPVPDGLLKQQPGMNNTEMVVTHSGYKQYIHSSCWYGMIAEQKKSKTGGETTCLILTSFIDGATIMVAVC